MFFFNSFLQVIFSPLLHYKDWNLLFGHVKKSKYWGGPPSERKVKEKFINGKYQVDMASKGDREDSGVFRQSTWHWTDTKKRRDNVCGIQWIQEWGLLTIIGWGLSNIRLTKVSITISKFYHFSKRYLCYFVSPFYHVHLCVLYSPLHHIGFTISKYRDKVVFCYTISPSHHLDL